MVPEIDVVTLAQRLAAPNPPILIDVREPDEFEFCSIAGAQLKPLGDIERWAGELDQDTEYVLQCHSGYRSGQAAGYLQSLGFKRVFNLTGGINAWSLHVDPNIPRY